MQASIDQQSTIIITMTRNFQPKNPGIKQVKSAENTLDLYFHIVLKFDGEILSDDERRKLQKYIVGYIRAKGAAVESIGFIDERVHLLIALPQSRALSDFVREIKLVSGLFARRRLALREFFWRLEYEAFTISFSEIEKINRYIRRQVEFQKQESYASSWHPVSFRRLY